jgi:tetratricopeptide (TPR) repeat protein
MDHLRTGHPSLPKPRLRRLAVAILSLALLGTSVVRADPADDAEQKLLQGDYAGAAADAQKAIKASYASEALVRVAAEALLTEGHYNEAYSIIEEGIGYAPESIRLHLLLHEACLYIAKPTDAAQALTTIDSILNTLANEQQNSPGPLPAQILADAGAAALVQINDPQQKLDPKVILERFLDPAQQATPPVRDAFLAAGQLELDKHDYDLASQSFGNGLKAFPNDPDMLEGLAAAFRDSDRQQFADNAEKALKANPNHIPTLLLQAENFIDSESFDKAGDPLDHILSINPNRPEALALKAVIAYLHNPPDQATTNAKAYRAKALALWKTNPQVDYIIGQKLSQNYRFTLGAEHENLALANDPQFTPARVQLAQDLLRLGQEEDGWKMAAQAHQEDGYDIEAFNLVTLHDEISQYTTITSNPHFRLVMEPQEASVYGAKVLDLLERARATVAKKYGLDLNFPVLVEIFPNTADFSVRTFGMPDIGEFLGVTFGPVVTLNAPNAGQGNWEDVLWHEFTHVVSLTITKNQMPRWLSEGISVYEEGQASPAWGEHLTPDARERILTGKMQPISNMSAAFLQAKDMHDTEFAYFESMLVVQFLIEHYGFDHLVALLHSIGDGLLINDAFEKNFAPLDQLDDQFAKYATDLAKKYAPDWDFTPPSVGTGDLAGLANLLPPDLANKLTTPAAPAPAAPKPAASTSKSFFDRLQQIQDLVDKEDWTNARDQLKELSASDFYLPGPDNPYLLLAQVCGKLKDTAGEKAALLTVAAHEGDSMPAASRLLEIAQSEKDWPNVVKWGEATLAIHPLAPTAWRALLDAHEQLGENTAGIEAGLALIALEQPDLPSLNYRVAKIMQPTDVDGARRHVLQALEDAPRFRAAYDLLAALPPSTPALPAPETAPAPSATPAATPATPATP